LLVGWTPLGFLITADRTLPACGQG